jgi:hypothetical protein
MTVYFECDNDEALLDIFSIPRKSKKHSFSKGNVCNSLEKVNDSKGMVDEDPQTQQNKYITSLGKPNQNKYNIKVFIDSKRNNKVIMLCPKLEDWLYTVAYNNKIKPTKFGLPKSSDDLHKMEFQKIKEKLSNFLNALLNTPEMQLLKSELA